MTPTPYFLPSDLMEDQHHQIFTPNPSQPSSSSSISYQVFLNSNSQDQNHYYHREVYQPQNQQDQANIENETNSGLKFSIWKQEVTNENQSLEAKQVKWMSSKMRLMHKMKKSDQTAVNTPPNSIPMKQPPSPFQIDNCSNIPIRVCSDCNTTKTPLWRSGPRGPKSLCNACGIRQRKARRAMAAAAEAAEGTIISSESQKMKITKVQHKDKKINGGQLEKFKKKHCKVAKTLSHGKPKLCLEDFLINLSKNLSFHRVFPQDEKEAAILLMALSCAHVHHN